MRIIPERPIELLRLLVQDHLLRVMVPSEQTAWMTDPAAPPPGRLTCYSIDPPSEIPLDLSTLSKRLVLSNPTKNSPTVTVLAAIGPETPGDGMMLVTDEGRPVFAMQTEVSIHDDGVIQISGAESGIVLLTAEEVRAQRGRTLMRGATTLKAFSLQKRSAAGTWKPLSFSISEEAIGPFQLKLD